MTTYQPKLATQSTHTASEKRASSKRFQTLHSRPRTMHKPFDEEHQLEHAQFDPPGSKGDSRLPGQPLIATASDPEILLNFLDGDLRSTDLDKMAPHLWLMATRSGSNISPLHHQGIKGRHILITEDPRLHLVWIHDRIFLKPLPKYLLSYAFWTKFLLLPTAIPTNSNTTFVPPASDHLKEGFVKAALGLLRSYSFLIRHESDLDVALECRLLPKNTSFESFCHFSSRFSSITDSEVSPRYGYGELRLTRLNFWSKVFLGRWNYEIVHRQYWEYFQQFYAPLLFVFGIFSVILSALQMEMAVESLESNSPSTRQWPSFWNFSRGFGVISLAIIAITALGLLALLMRRVVVELLYALTHRREKHQ